MKLKKEWLFNDGEEEQLPDPEEEENPEAPINPPEEKELPDKP